MNRYRVFVSTGSCSDGHFIKVELMESDSKSPVLLTVREVSKLLRIHRPKVYDLIKAGDIEGFKLGADWRIKRASIEKLVGEITKQMLRD